MQFRAPSLVLFASILLLALTSGSARADDDFGDLPECTLYSPINQLCKADLTILKPLQTPIGLRSVSEQAERLGQMSKDKYHKELMDDAIPLVVGLNRLNILDHHHLGRSVRMLGKHHAVGIIKYNWNHMSKDQFIQALVDRHFFYDRDENDQLITFDELAVDLDHMRDDPYRSLSGDVRRAGGYVKKEGDYFIEFTWDHFFRNLTGDNAISLKDLDKHYKDSLKKAMKIARSPIASHLPGAICNSGLQIQ